MRPERRDGSARIAVAVDAIVAPLAGIAVSFALFGVFVGLAGASPLNVYYQMYRGSFGSWFSFQNTLLRAAPLMLTGLCTALPAHLGLVIIGGEGALVLGALASVVAAHALDGANAWVVLVAMEPRRLRGRRRMDCARGGASHLPRRQRDHQQPAPQLHRHRRLQAFGRRADARPREP